MHHPPSMSIGEVAIILALIAAGVAYAVVIANGERAEIEARDRDPFGYVRNKLPVSVVEVLFGIFLIGVVLLGFGAMFSANATAGAVFSVVLLVGVGIAAFDALSTNNALRARSEDPTAVSANFSPPLSEVFALVVAIVGPLSGLAMHWAVTVVAAIAVIGSVVYALREVGAMEAWSSRRG